MRGYSRIPDAEIRITAHSIQRRLSNVPVPNYPTFTPPFTQPLLYMDHFFSHPEVGVEVAQILKVPPFQLLQTYAVIAYQVNEVATELIEHFVSDDPYPAQCDPEFTERQLAHYGYGFELLTGLGQLANERLVPSSVANHASTWINALVTWYFANINQPLPALPHTNTAQERLQAYLSHHNQQLRDVQENLNPQLTDIETLVWLYALVHTSQSRQLPALFGSRQPTRGWGQRLLDKYCGCPRPLTGIFMTDTGEIVRLNRHLTWEEMRQAALTGALWGISLSVGSPWLALQLALAWLPRTGAQINNYVYRRTAAWENRHHTATHEVTHALGTSVSSDRHLIKSGLSILQLAR